MLWRLTCANDCCSLKCGLVSHFDVGWGWYGGDIEVSAYVSEHGLGSISEQLDIYLLWCHSLCRSSRRRNHVSSFKHPCTAILETRQQSQHGSHQHTPWWKVRPRSNQSAPPWCKTFSYFFKTYTWSVRCSEKSMTHIQTAFKGFN